MTCDVCGRRFTSGDDGQRTAETMMCGECTRRVAERSAELVRRATEEIDPHAPDLGGEAG